MYLPYSLFDQQGNCVNVVIGPRHMILSVMRQIKQSCKKTAVISIVTPGQEFNIRPYTTSNIRAIQLSIYDEDTGEKACTAHDFEGLRQFLDHDHHVNNLLFHCDAGASRSPAVAWAVCDYLHLKTIAGYSFGKIATTGYAPNMRVYRTCLKALTES